MFLTYLKNPLYWNLQKEEYWLWALDSWIQSGDDMAEFNVSWTAARHEKKHPNLPSAI